MYSFFDEIQQHRSNWKQYLNHMDPTRLPILAHQDNETRRTEDK